ncbi:hypothetical protein [Undibacterium flavidum]|uniref:Lipoprotein n=1 Tax=Undibacterium flavidum TaxID=2762297 RepID=A0ABR6Y786_9BURK|nr:hypothetical protein [Undibacterium flavidum]MBC3872476.1 hypothetical protein [Undibacterium flavidum]
MNNYFALGGLLRPFILIIVLMSLSACASLGQNDKSTDKFSPAGIFDKSVENIDMISLLSDEDLSSKSGDKADFSKTFDQALRSAKGKNEEDRNHIQNRLILASNSLCEEYKTVLKRKQSNMNFWMGSAATLFGAGGAIANGAQAAKNFAALAGLTTGVRAEYNQAYYADLMAHVITKAISKRRKLIFDEIQEAKTASIKEYNLEMALADVATCHGACSLIAGLETADDLVSKYNVSLGLDTLGASLTKPAKDSKAEKK